LGFNEACLLARNALICFAGDGGGKGLLKNLRGVEVTLELAGEFL